MSRPFRPGEWVIHRTYARTGDVNAYTEDGDVTVYWDVTRQPLGPEKIPVKDLLSLTKIPDGMGNWDYVRELVAIGKIAMRSIDDIANGAIGHGWDSGDIRLLSLEQRTLRIIDERISFAVARAEAEGRN